MVAIETTNERWFEAEANCIAGQITLLSPEPNAAKAQAYFERALKIARQQKAKSWELRAATSMARLWSDPGQARAGSRSSCSDLWLVHRGLRHARS
jgi:predicted ATPase